MKCGRNTAAGSRWNQNTGGAVGSTRHGKPGVPRDELGLCLNGQDGRAVDELTDHIPLARQGEFEMWRVALGGTRPVGQSRNWGGT